MCKMANVKKLNCVWEQKNTILLLFCSPNIKQRWKILRQKEYSLTMKNIDFIDGTGENSCGNVGQKCLEI